jgi:chromosome segregation ATPase
MNANLPTEEEALTFGKLLAQLGEDYEQSQKELKEIEVLIQQSSSEVEKLAQRNAQLANKLRQVEANIDTIPRHDIREVYTAAQEAQMRLFMMRGQVEQLQAKQQHLERHSSALRQVLEVAGRVGMVRAGGKVRATMRAAPSCVSSMLRRTSASVWLGRCTMVRPSR